MKPELSSPPSKKPDTWPCPEWFQSSPVTPPCPISWRSSLILFSHLCLGLPSVLSFRVFSPNPCTHLPPPIRATWPTHFILLTMITLTVCRTEYKSWTNWFCITVQPLGTSSPLGPNIPQHPIFEYPQFIPPPKCDRTKFHTHTKLLFCVFYRIHECRRIQGEGRGSTVAVGSVDSPHLSLRSVGFCCLRLRTIVSNCPCNATETRDFRSNTTAGEPWRLLKAVQRRTERHLLQIARAFLFGVAYTSAFVCCCTNHALCVCRQRVVTVPTKHVFIFHWLALKYEKSTRHGLNNPQNAKGITPERHDSTHLFIQCHSQTSLLAS